MIYIMLNMANIFFGVLLAVSAFSYNIFVGLYSLVALVVMVVAGLIASCAIYQQRS